MTPLGLRASAGLLAAATLLGVTGCAAHRHWMTAAPTSASATSHPTTDKMAPFQAPAGLTTTQTAETAPASASPSPTPATQPATPQGEGASSVPAPHRGRRHHTRVPGSAVTAHHLAGTRPAGRHGGSPCDALAHEGGLPGNLYGQCRQLYG
jgi:hypothetical protein